MKSILLLMILFIMMAGCKGDVTMTKEGNKEMNLEIATFAGGCFWCMEPPFEKLNGVIDVTSGYTGGEKKDPLYKEVCTGKTGHFEAVEITYDPKKISYEELLKVFWKNIDPTDPEGQFADKGSQYKSAIFYHNEEQKILAEKSKKILDKSGIYSNTIATQIIKFNKFYKAEDYHQDYYKKNFICYTNHREELKRNKCIDELWEKEMINKSSENKTYKTPSKDELKKNLTPLQYSVTQENSTEPPFKNEYWDNKNEGIYVDIVTGEPLFSSLDKFDSGCGWPSFTKPVVSDIIEEKIDNSHFMERTEVRSKKGDSHLGHVFHDGPQPTGLRYCINSASLRFIPRGELEKEGYGEYLKLFH